MAISLVCQVLVAVSVDAGGPVRFGFPLPAEVLRRGLAVAGAPGLSVQWRRLQMAPDPQTKRQWCEIAIGGAALAQPTRVKICVGAVPETLLGVDGALAGAVFSRTTETTRADGIATDACVWRWADGTVEQSVRHRVVEGELEVAGERLGAGEALTETSAAVPGRTLRAHIAADSWAAAGVIPRPTPVCLPWRTHLCGIAKQLVDLPGVRGAGDFGRSGGVVTNLEFDTALGFVRLGLAAVEPLLLRRAWRSARHTIDCDLDAATGLPFAHGPDHRVRPTEPGHVWLQGLLLTGCVFADETLLAAAGTMAHALARQPRAPLATERDDRARDVGWPLLELEAWLRWRDDLAVRRAADALAADVLRRYDRRAGVLRFGEGERRDGAYEDRAWLTGGILVPALRAYALRTRDPRARAIVADLEQRLLGLLRRGQSGIPIRYYVDRDGLGSELRLSGVAEAFLMVEGLAPADLKKVLARGQVAASLEGVPRVDDEDVATAFSMAARCTWVLR